MSLSKKDLEMIAMLIKQSKADDTTTTKQEKKTSKQEKKSGKQHVRSEIPNIIKNMSKQETIDIFGDMTLNPKQTPYICSIEKFFNKYNIQLRERKDGSVEKPFLSRAIRHQIIIKQLSGETKSRFNTVKNNCISFLKEKIDAIPKDTDVLPLQKRREFNLQELERWNNENFTGKTRPTSTNGTDEEN